MRSWTLHDKVRLRLLENISAQVFSAVLDSSVYHICFYRVILRGSFVVLFVLLGIKTLYKVTEK